MHPSVSFFEYKEVAAALLRVKYGITCVEKESKRLNKLIDSAFRSKPDPLESVSA